MGCMLSPEAGRPMRHCCGIGEGLRRKARSWSAKIKRAMFVN
ncbi:MAG: hypothetical protein ACLRXQ_06625 [Phascolarctobacterium faecium]